MTEMEHTSRLDRKVALQLREALHSIESNCSNLEGLLGGLELQAELMTGRAHLEQADIARVGNAVACIARVLRGEIEQVGERAGRAWLGLGKQAHAQE
jgi:hypothetical protein